METFVCNNRSCGNYREDTKKRMQNHCCALKDGVVLRPDDCECFISIEKDRLITERGNWGNLSKKLAAAERLQLLHG